MRTSGIIVGEHTVIASPSPGHRAQPFGKCNSTIFGGEALGDGLAAGDDEGDGDSCARPVPSVNAASNTNAKKLFNMEISEERRWCSGRDSNPHDVATTGT